MVMECYFPKYRDFALRRLAKHKHGLRVFWPMIENSNDFRPSRSLSGSIGPADYLVLTLEMPDVEEIAKAIWERRHNRLPSHTLSYQRSWRDESVPDKFWEEFLLDAQAVLRLLYRKHVEYCNK
jgi:hypothetical protein